jgi:hypothetical protein
MADDEDARTGYSGRKASDERPARGSIAAKFDEGTQSLKAAAERLTDAIDPVSIEGPAVDADELGELVQEGIEPTPSLAAQGGELSALEAP